MKGVSMLYENTASLDKVSIAELWLCNTIANMLRFFQCRAERIAAFYVRVTDVASDRVSIAVGIQGGVDPTGAQFLADVARGRVDLLGDPALRQVAILARQCGGELLVYEEPGSPSNKCLNLVLPALPDNNAETVPCPCTVLVCDDQPVLTKHYRRYLELDGHTVTSTITGTDALAAAKAEPPDVIVLDLNLPDISGYDVIRSLRAYRCTAETPIIVVSATNSPERTARLGANLHLVKPVYREELRNAVRWFAVKGLPR
jgi:CheY-like chemotaxis protein